MGGILSPRNCAPSVTCGRRIVCPGLVAGRFQGGRVLCNQTFTLLEGFLATLVVRGKTRNLSPHGNYSAPCDITGYERDCRGSQLGRKVEPAPISDEALMLAFQAGSREAFEHLFTRYRGPLYGFFHRRLYGDQRAEDLTQETFLAVIRAVAHYEPRALVRTYFYGIAMNLLAAERRTQRKHPPAPEEVREPATENSSEAALWVRQALEKLDESEREILMLREYEQLSYAEIGELLKLPVNTVRSRLFRARMALKEWLEPGRNAERTAEREVPKESRLARAEGEAI